MTQIYQLLSPFSWLKQGRRVNPSETPIKCLARSAQSENQEQIQLFGQWQTKALERQPILDVKQDFLNISQFCRGFRKMNTGILKSFMSS